MSTASRQRFHRVRPLLASLFTATLLLAGVALVTAPGVWAKTRTVYILSNIDQDCHSIESYTTQDIHIVLPYTGTVTEATLLMRSTNVLNTFHPIQINGVDIGQTPPTDNFSVCSQAAPVREYTLSPTLLQPGLNVLRLTSSGTSDSWGVNYMALKVRGENIKGSSFVPIQFPGDGGQLVDALVLSPTEKGTPRPLLLLFHGWNGVPFEVYKTDYTPAAVQRDWFVAAPVQRGQNTLGPANAPLASLRSQHDAIQLIAYMRSHYPIDPDRIYVGGFSMGGMMAGVMAAKYSDVFAAAVTHKAVTDLADWYDESSDFRQSRIVTETGGTPLQKPFEYRRRSPVEFASNFRNLPIAVVHGSADTTVPPHHAQDFYDALQGNTPNHAELHWYPGNHGDEALPFGGEWAADFMQTYTRLDSPTSLRLRTDESKPFYWLGVGKHSTQSWTEVLVDVDVPGKHIDATVTDTLSLDLNFDLGRMGLDPFISYVISQTNAAQGTSITAVTPIAGSLGWTVPAGVTRLEVFPNNGDLPVLLYVQEGSQGYAGASDTWLNAWSTTSNYGSFSSLSLRTDGVAKGLLRFDLTGMLPHNVEILAANLKFYADAGGPAMTVNLHPLLRLWNEATATYNLAASGQDWAQPGGSPGQDWANQPVATFDIPAAEGVVTTSVIDSVRDWVQNPASNFGLVLLPASASFNSARTLRTGEHSMPATRPRLEIIYRPLPPSPTPTPTPTNTPTVTPTATPAMGDIDGIVYHDSSSDGAYQPGEPTLGGAVVELWQGQNLRASRATGSDGVFEFTDLQVGDYVVKEQAPSGYSHAWPTDTFFVGVGAGQHTLIEFGHQPLPTPTATPTATTTVVPWSLFLPLVRQ